MDVTRLNFEKLFPDIKRTIDQATFIAIDGEFTGLNNGNEATPFDTLPEFYSKIKNGSKDFLLIQLGICAFQYESASNSYKYSCYNFYAFPRPQTRSVNDFRFMCQSSSIDFLAAQGFDFNKLFYNGIPYLTKDEASQLREQLQEKIKSREDMHKNVDQSLIAVPDSDKEFIEQMSLKVKEFLESDQEELILDRCNSFLRRLLYQELNLKFKNQLFLDSRTQDNRNIVFVVQKAQTPEEYTLKENLRREREENEITEGVGLSRVLQHISSSGKLVVGHNILLDMIHIIKQFFGPLPQDYQDFKDLVHSIFPRLLDTKVLSSMGPFKEKINSSVLGHLLSTLSMEPFTLPEVEQEKEGVGYLKSENREHEAGYDAYITGLCLLSMSSYIKGIKDQVWNGECDIISCYMNRIFNMRLQDIPYHNLVGKDAIPSRDHVFHVTFPKVCKKSDLNQLFSVYGPVYIFWINDKTAYVALNKRENSSQVMEAFSKLKTSEYTVIPYKQHKALSHELPNQKGEAAAIDLAIDMRSGRKRRMTSELSKPKEEVSSVSNIDKYGPSTKVPRKSTTSSNALDLSETKKPRTNSTSGVFNVSEDWN